jgi:hypothetical protein
MTRLRTLNLTAIAAILAGAAAPALGDLPSYHATMLDDMVEAVFPGVEFPGSDARGLNENGDVIGEASLNYDPSTGSKMQAFIYTVEHGVVALPLPTGWPSNAVRDISDRDENGEVIIVGGGVPGPYVDIVIGEAALWRYSTVTGEVLETRLLGIPAGFTDSFAMAVNNDGIIAGFSSLTGAFTNWKYDVATGVMETFDFPMRIADMNNLGQVCGGSYRGDLLGNYEDLTETYEPGDNMPWWAIENGGITAAWYRINDQGWLSGRAPTGISDGAHHHKVAIVRFADPIGWTGMPPISHLTLAGGINYDGDFMDRHGGLYLEEMGALYSSDALLAPEWDPLVSVYWSNEVSDNRQIAGSQAHVFVLTPLGEMIIPGDVNGDVSVDLDDHCAWTANPIDLDGDGDVDADDEQWLRDRLAVFGLSVEDCNGNGAGDHCDIVASVSQDCDLNGVPDECQSDCNGDGVPDVCEPDCNANGVPDPCDIATHTSNDCNANGIPDECDEGGVTQVTIDHDPPVFMYQSDTIVEDVLVVDAGIVDDVNLQLDYRYRIGYTKVELSHNGTTVTILDRPGHPLHMDGFVNFGYVATVDDEGTGPLLENIGDYCCSFETILSPPSYRPNEALSAFEGMPSEGIWTFTMTTTPDFSSGDGLHGWGLTITRAAVPVPPCCPADITGPTVMVPDGNVDALDYLALIAQWGTPGPEGDITGAVPMLPDGIVDAMDFLVLIAQWGTPAECP